MKKMLLWFAVWFIWSSVAFSAGYLMLAKEKAYQAETCQTIETIKEVILEMPTTTEKTVIKEVPVEKVVIKEVPKEVIKEVVKEVPQECTAPTPNVNQCKYESEELAKTSQALQNCEIRMNFFSRTLSACSTNLRICVETGGRY